MSTEKCNNQKTINLTQEFYILNNLDNNNKYDKETKLNNYNLLKSSTVGNDASTSSASINSNECDINNNSDSNNKSNKNLNARRRWKLLSRAIITAESGKSTNQTKLNKIKRKSPPILKKSKSNEENEEELEVEVVSQRRFESFELIQHEQLSSNVKQQLIGSQDNWLNYKLHCDSNENFNVNIHHINRPWTAKDLIGFNNTGNICVWPSEEALSYFVLDNLKIFKGTWILELGGGMSCMAALFLAKYAEPYLVHLTDGNNLSVENIKKSIRLNDFNCFTKCSALKWEQLQRKFHPIEMGKYDFILSADCIFFDDSRNALIDTINYYLTANGQAFVMAPKRGHTLDTFVNMSITKGFKCEIFNYYNKHIWNKHLELLKTKEYNQDIHYPILIKMMRSK